MPESLLRRHRGGPRPADPGRGARPVKIGRESLIVEAELTVGDRSTAGGRQTIPPADALEGPGRDLSTGQGHAELAKAEFLLAHGIATPRPLLACRPRGWATSSTSFLVTEWIAGAENLHLFGWRIAAAAARRAASLAARCAEALGRLIGRMHAAGAAHRDLKAANLLVVEERGDVTVYLVDLDGLQPGGLVGFQRQARDLARLAAGLAAHPWVTRSICRRFLRATEELPAGAATGSRCGGPSPRKPKGSFAASSSAARRCCKPVHSTSAPATAHGLTISAPSPVWRKTQFLPADLAPYKAASARASNDSCESPSRASATPPLTVKRHLLGDPVPQAVGKTRGPFQIGFRHDHQELLAAVAGHDVGLADRFIDQPGQLGQHLVAVEVPLHVVDLLEVVDVEHGDGEPRAVAIHQGQLRAQGVVQAAAIVHAGERIGADLGEGHEVGALLADFVVGVGNLGRQAERGAEDLLGLAAKVLPGGLLLLLVQLADPLAELAHAGMMPHQGLAKVPGDLFQFGRHELRPPQFAPRSARHIAGGPLASPADQIADQGHDGQGEGSEQGLPIS